MSPVLRTNGFPVYRPGDETGSHPPLDPRLEPVIGEVNGVGLFTMREGGLEVREDGMGPLIGDGWGIYNEYILFF